MRDTLSKEVGRVVRVLRTLRGLSYTEFAEKAQLSATYLRQVERGERDLGLGALGTIAEGLNCDVRRLLPGDGRSAVASLVAELFDQSSEAQQEAILFLLVMPDDSPKKRALLALMAEDKDRARPTSKLRPPESVQEPASSGRDRSTPTTPRR